MQTCSVEVVASSPGRNIRESTFSTFYVPEGDRLGPHPLFTLDPHPPFSLWKLPGGRSCFRRSMPGPLDDSDEEEEIDLDQEEEEDHHRTLGIVLL